MSQQVRVQVLFTEQTEKGSFTDALYFTQAEFATAKQSDIDVMVAARVDAWRSYVSPAPKPVTDEELQSEKASIDQMIAGLELRKQEIETILK